MREALTRWRGAIDSERLDGASRSLLPLAWWNLERHAVSDGDLGLFRHAFVESWVRTQQLLETLGVVLAAFQAAGVPVLVFKGAALTLGAYPKPGLRPMTDLDLLVPPAAEADGIRVLERLGARRTSADPERRRAMLHGTELLLERGGMPVAVDLHRSALWECRRPGDDEALWAASVPLPGTAADARMPCAADHLLVVCIHGLRWSPGRPIRWIADAMLLIEKLRGPEDWARLVAEARRRRLAWTLRVALRFLVRVFDAAVPSDALAALGAGRNAVRDRLELAFRSRPPSLARGLFLHWCDHARMSAIRSPFGRLATFPGYLREMWAVETLRDVPAQALRKALSR